MLTDIIKIKNKLSKKEITEHDIKECLYLIEKIIKNKPDVSLIYETARSTNCKTMFVEWFFVNVLNKKNNL